MERFVAECNINRFEQMLRETDDPVEQRLLEELLAEERARLTRAVVSGMAEPVSLSRADQLAAPGIPVQP